MIVRNNRIYEVLVGDDQADLAQKVNAAIKLDAELVGGVAVVRWVEDERHGGLANWEYSQAILRLEVQKI